MGTGLTMLLVMALVLIRTYPALARQWREDRKGFVWSLILLILFLVWCVAGVLALFAMIPDQQADRDKMVFAATAAMLAWIAYGGLWLLRLVPRYQEVPSWLLRPFGIPDALLLGILILAAIWM